MTHTEHPRGAACLCQTPPRGTWPGRLLLRSGPFIIPERKPRDEQTV
jgi:hypothetical protein